MLGPFRVLLGACLVLVCACRTLPAADFGFARVKDTDAGESYGTVSILPFSASREGAIPIFLLVDAGDYADPVLRAKHVSQLLPKVVELLFARGEALKVGPDLDGHPALFVGPHGKSITRTDLHVVSVLAGDLERFRREAGTDRRLDRTAVAHYWKLLLEDLLALFIRYPLSRDRKVVGQLHLGATRSGVILKKILIEVSILLRYENLTEESASPTQLKAKILEVLQAMTRDQWSQLVGLAFQVPEDLQLPADRGGPDATGG
jgi:hypothetical protein